jgi:hypothetical protein
MAITNVDGLVNALANNSSRLIINKASLGSQTAGRYCSLWRATGEPGQGAIPTTAARCDMDLTGSPNFAPQTDPMKSYLGWLFAASGNAATTVEVWDRLAHVGGLALNITTLQPSTGSLIDLSTLSIPAGRLGQSDYSDVQWWLEVYADGGSTASNATINVTFGDDTSANLNNQAVGGTIRIGNLFSLNALIPVAHQGKFIKRVNSVQLSANTGSAGNFGFTATRPRASIALNIANKTEVSDWAALGLPSIPNDSCLMYAILPTTTSSGTLRGGGKIAHG